MQRFKRRRDMVCLRLESPLLPFRCAKPAGVSKPKLDNNMVIGRQIIEQHWRVDCLLAAPRVLSAVSADEHVNRNGRSRRITN